MKHLLPLLALAGAVALGTPAPGYAQQASLSAGVRLGSPTGLSVKYFVTEELALEGIFGVRGYLGTRGLSSYSAMLAGHYHWDLDLDDPDFEPLRIYAGAGLGLTRWRYGDRFFRGRAFGRDDDRYADFSVGLRAFVGAQYAFAEVPLEITLDAGPSLNTGDLFVSAFYVHYSLGVRYVLGYR